MNANVSAVSRAVRLALLVSVLPAGAAFNAEVHAQASPPPSGPGDGTSEALSEVVVTGTRIQVPGVTSSSPVLSVGASEIDQLQQPEVEKIFRILPITLPTDGQNVNNGTAGAATISLRGLGAQRNVLLMDGKRITPFDVDGVVDTSTIPVALIERVDIITGGASAVYGSDAISGAVNFVMKRDFEGLEIDSDYSLTGESDGAIKSASLTFGSNVADGRGNLVMSMNYADREGVQLGARPLGRLGIVTASAAGLAQFQSGLAPTAAPAGCDGPNAVAAGGSTTTVPTRASIAGGPALGQFRNDGTLGSNCSVFNFNPYNYYQTPQTRYGATALGHLELNERAEIYGRLAFTNTKVRAQVAPSGLFGDAFFTPLGNPFLSAQARGAIIAAAEAGRLAVDPMTGLPAPTVATTGDFPNWRDLNGNDRVDAADDLLISYRRRTVEFGERSETFTSNYWNFVIGTRGTIGENWDYDTFFQRGQSDRVQQLAGYTNTPNIALAVDSVSANACRSGGSCVPINLFGGAGSITPQMAAFSAATALLTTGYTQQILGASLSGSMPGMQLPWAETALALSFGGEYREEQGDANPDECLKLAPDSCLGGRGGNTLPIIGGFDVKEVFAEAILPIASERPGLRSLDLELGYRFSDYNPTGNNRTWKYGLSWRPVESVLVRAMRQRAARAPNVGELAAPQVTGLDNATLDPCSIVNAAAIDATLRARCVSTGMTAAQVGTVEDIVAGQVNTFEGTDLNDLPEPELADTTTFGIVWTPGSVGRIRNPVISIDYYDIDISGYIDEFGVQEILDGCYKSGLTDQCAKIVRVGGTLTLPGSGVRAFTTNLDYIRAEGVELGVGFGVDAGSSGTFRFSANVNAYLVNEYQSASFTSVTDCNGFFGNQCGNPLPELRWIQRTTWEKGPFEASLLWRHLGSARVEPAQLATTAPVFQRLQAIDYLDLTAAYSVRENVRLRVSVSNLLDEDPPIVGNEAGATFANSGNTFPSVYDTLGRVFSVGLNLRF